MNSVFNKYKSQKLFISSAIVLSWCSGCTQSDRAAPGQTGASRAGAALKPRGAETSVTDYKLKGVVRRVERETRHVRIRHEAIPGFMDAMEMRFMIKDTRELESVRPGDEVAAVLRVWRREGAVTDYQLSGLTVTKSAAPPAMVLDLSTGAPRLSERPRRLAPGEQVPDFALTAQDGQTFRLSDLRGKVVVLTFVYTRCPLPDFCPFMDRKFAELAERLSALPRARESVRLISVSFDPEHDTPEVLRRHAQIRGATPPLWGYAVASHAELAKVAAPLGLVYGANPTEIAHNLCTAVIDAQGRLARLEVGTKSNHWETAEFLKTIYSLMPGSAH
jgi:protein SCO1